MLILTELQTISISIARRNQRGLGRRPQRRSTVFKKANNVIALFRVTSLMQELTKGPMSATQAADRTTGKVSNTNPVPPTLAAAFWNCVVQLRFTLHPKPIYQTKITIYKLE
ncbi:MAG: hypothetical protein AAI978_00250 [Candidatus Hodgkinia cicadicola]